MADIAKRPIDTFTLGFHGDRAISEHTHAALVSRHIGAKHHVLMLDPGDMLGALDQWTKTFDEPLADPAALPTMLLAKLTRQHVTVVLTGEGADEVFSGYGNYATRVREERITGLLGARLRRFGIWCARCRARAQGPAAQGNRRAALAPLRHDPYGIRRALHPRSCRRRSSRRARRAWRTTPSAVSRMQFREYIDKLMYIDARLWLPDDLLTKVDRATMAYSLSARALPRSSFSSSAAARPELKQRGRPANTSSKKLAEKAAPRSCTPKQGFFRRSPNGSRPSRRGRGRLRASASAVPGGALSTLAAEHYSGQAQALQPPVGAVRAGEVVPALRAGVRALACAGSAGSSRSARWRRRSLRAMQAALRPRGPDAQHAKLWERNAACCMRDFRSSIRGPLADQPMANERGDIWIVYNGEVYDWEAAAADLRAPLPFRTRSDTEFILRGYEAWGIETLLERLRGMFAFAILDLAQGQGVPRARPHGREAARLQRDDGELAFGSTVRAVLPFLPRGKRELSPEAIDAYLAHRYVPAPRTVYRHIQRLENGHYLEFDLRSRELAKRRYWHPAPSAGRGWTRSTSRCACAPSPIGRSAYSCRRGRLHRGREPARAPAPHEFPHLHRRLSPAALWTSRRPRPRRRATRLSEHRGCHRRFDRPAISAPIVAALDEPFADPSSFPTWYLAREVSREVKVVLAGDGGDELFAGYKRIAKHCARPGAEACGCRFRCARRRGRQARDRARDGLAHGLQPALLRHSRPRSARFCRAAACEALALLARAGRRGRYAAEQLMAIDYANYLPEYVLRKSDLCTMAHGLEARAPFLDHRFVQRLRAVPEESVCIPAAEAAPGAGARRASAGQSSAAQEARLQPAAQALAARGARRALRRARRAAAKPHAGPARARAAVDAFVQRYSPARSRLPSRCSSSSSSTKASRSSRRSCDGWPLAPRLYVLARAALPRRRARPPRCAACSSRTTSCSATRSCLRRSSRSARALSGCRDRDDLPERLCAALRRPPVRRAHLPFDPRSLRRPPRVAPPARLRSRARPGRQPMVRARARAAMRAGSSPSPRIGEATRIGPSTSCAPCRIHRWLGATSRRA